MSASDSNPAYVSARVRHRRASLFEQEEYRKLVRMGPGEIARYMEDGEYGPEINELGSRYSGVDLIEYALNQNLSRHFHELLEYSDGRLYEQVARYLRKFDAWNVKTLLRGLYADADKETIEADLIRAGEFDEDFLDRLLNAPSIEELISALERTIFGDGLADAVTTYEETGLLVPLENAVDRAYFDGLLESVERQPDDRARELYVEFLRAEIDFRNLRNALRLATNGTDLDPAEYFIEGGDLFDEAEIRRLVNSKDELVGVLRESTYGPQLSGAIDDLETADSLLGFERALDAALLSYSKHLSYQFPLSVCPVLSFILAKEREVENVRAIARGRGAGLSEDEIESELVIQ